METIEVTACPTCGATAQAIKSANGVTYRHIPTSEAVRVISPEEVIPHIPAGWAGYQISDEADLLYIVTKVLEAVARAEKALGEKG